MERGRWDALFADLEGELDGERARELDDEVADRARYEQGRLALADRLLGNVGAEVVVATLGGGTLRGRLADAAKDWLRVEDALVPRTSVLSIGGLGPEAVDPHARPKVSRSLASALRWLDGPVTCMFVDGRTVRATVGRVGRDHVDLDGHTVPFRAIAVIRPA